MTTKNIWVNFMQILCLFEMSNSNLNETAFSILSNLCTRFFLYSYSFFEELNNHDNSKFLGIGKEVQPNRCL